MRLMVLGLNHKNAGIDLREKLAINSHEHGATIDEIMQHGCCHGVVLLSTCNRTEIYFESASAQTILRWIKKRRQIDAQELKELAYLHTDEMAVQHLMQVASGLDSMVLGEVEILGQLKAAYQLSIMHGCISKRLGRLFQMAFSVAKKVRTQTQIGHNPISVAYLAVRLAERVFKQLSNQVVLIVGAGDTARLMLQHLCGAGVRSIILANRSGWRAQELARDFSQNGVQVEIIALHTVPDWLPRADILITTTAAPLPIIGKGMVERAIKARKHRSMFMVDLSVPRNIEPQVGEIADVYLYGIDDLQVIAAEHQRTRSSAVVEAELIIAPEVTKFMGWLESQHAISTIQEFRAMCEQQRDQALGEALRQLQSGKDPNLVLQRFAQVLLNRWIHEPTVQMRKASAMGNNELLAVVRQLFQVNIAQENIQEELKEESYERVDTQ